MIVLVHYWHDLLHPSKLLFFSRSVNTDIGHSLQPLFCFLSRYFSSLPSLCRWCALLGMQEADHQAAENWGSFLFVCSPFHAAHPPFSAVAWPPPPTPGVMSTADAIRWGHANFVIENQSASQPSHLCTDRDTVWTEKVSIIMQEGSQIEPFVFLHEGRDKEVPGWIPRALTSFQ